MIFKRVCTFFLGIFFLLESMRGFAAVKAYAQTLSVTDPMVCIGEGFVVALTAEGDAYAWGKNRVGQLGNGATSTSEKEPVAVASDQTFVQIAAGSAHALALDTDGAVWAWGENGAGQLGNASTEDQNTPVKIQMPENVNFVAIAAGENTSFALSETGRVWVWGSNQTGLLANGESGSNKFSNIPVFVSALESQYITSIWTDQGVAAAISADGGVWLWGDNQYRQTGVSSGNVITTPTRKNAASADAIVFGTTHTAFLSDGAVKSLGINQNAIFGNGEIDTELYYTVPTSATFSANALPILKIASGSAHMIALSSDKSLYTWGNGSNSQLGYSVADSSKIQKTPKAVALDLGEKQISEIAAGYQNSAVIDSDGFVYLWGKNDAGQLGDSGVTSTQTEAPVAVQAGEQGGTLLCLGKPNDRIVQKVPITATVTVPSPTYQITVPATLNVGTLTQASPAEADATRISKTTLSVSATAVDHLFGEKRVVVKIEAPNGRFQLVDGDYTLPYNIYPTADSTDMLQSGDIFAVFYESDETVVATGRIELDRSLITRSGNYSGSVTFLVEVAPLS